MGPTRRQVALQRRVRGRTSSDSSHFYEGSSSGATPPCLWINALWSLLSGVYAGGCAIESICVGTKQSPGKEYLLVPRCRSSRKGFSGGVHAPHLLWLALSVAGGQIIVHICWLGATACCPLSSEGEEWLTDWADDWLSHQSFTRDSELLLHPTPL